MIKQAIIPLAGLGTRLLPLTSVFAKELLPINGKPGLEYIIQECIEDSLGKDLRVLVVNGKVVGCMMRQSIDGDFRANITRGGEAIPYQIDEDIEWIGGECARLLD